MHGTVTAALAGDFAQPHHDREQKTAAEMSSYVTHKMPFDRMKAKLSSDIQPPTDIQLENYFTINFTGISGQKREGR
jgi:hypothetical protein